MNTICFRHFCYLWEVSRLVEIGRVLPALGHDVEFFSHGGTYENVAALLHVHADAVLIGWNLPP